MFKIQTLNSISPKGLQQFPKDQYTVSSDEKNPDAILVRSQNMHDLTIPSSVKVIGRAGAGVNNIPIAKMTELGLPVLNTPGANANAVRELVLAGMLIASRNISQALQYVHALESNPEMDQRIEKDKKQFAGFELLGKTLGVIGLGSIGVKVANAALHLGMRVIGYDPTITVNRAWELSSSVIQAHDIDEVLRAADFVTFHVPLNAATKHLINAERLSIMHPHVVLLNFARDGIIDNAALLRALNENKISAYINDFPTPELKNHPKVVSLPHLGASTREAEENCADMIVNQTREFLENGGIQNSVNFPNVEIPKLNGGTRIAVVNRNIPNMVAQISSTLASEKLNIVSLVNKSRESIAYTVLDLETGISDAMTKKLESIEGVVHVRQL